MMNLLWWALVGLVAGWVTGKIMKGSGYGVIMDIILGILGALLGGWIMTRLGFAGGGLVYTILVAIAGAIILVAIVRLIKK
ncbi:MAG: GlsB/YeaQ/YmgE family stress response membrane protein [Candidatus Acidiferrales bacterium]